MIVAHKHHTGGNAKKLEFDLEAEKDQKNYDKGYRDVTAQLLKERVATPNRILDDTS